MKPLHLGITTNNARGVNGMRPIQERNAKTNGKQQAKLDLAELVSQAKTPDELRECLFDLLQAMGTHCAHSADPDRAFASMVLSFTQGWLGQHNHNETNTAQA